MNITYTLVLFGLVTFANGWITWYFAYFKKTGEYQAIRENVDEITKITEGIKHDFDIIKQNQVGLKSEQRRVVIQYYKVIYEMINKLPSVRVMMFARGHEVKDFTKNTKTTLMFAEAELLLFVSDERVRNGSQLCHSSLATDYRCTDTVRICYESARVVSQAEIRRGRPPEYMPLTCVGALQKTRMTNG